MMNGEAKTWKLLRFELPARVEEELTGFLDGRCRGLRVRAAGSGRSRMEIYLAPEDSPREVRERVLDGLVRLGAGAERPEFELETVEDENWVETYQAGLKPFPVGKRFLVVPGVETVEVQTEAAEAGRKVLRLIPGRAFGTGEHPTTALSIRALEKAVRPGSAWMDAGAGSGILSVVAAMLGAGKVTALENDPDAVDVCREVVAYNGLEKKVAILEGSMEKVLDRWFDGVVANIHASFFLEHSDRIASLLRPGGRLLCTGFLGTDAEEISAGLGAAALSILARHDAPPWVLFEAKA